VPADSEERPAARGGHVRGTRLAGHGGPRHDRRSGTGRVRHPEGGLCAGPGRTLTRLVPPGVPSVTQGWAPSRGSVPAKNTRRPSVARSRYAAVGIGARTTVPAAVPSVRARWSVPPKVTRNQ